MDRHEESQTALTQALHRGLYLAVIMDHHEGPHTLLTIALHKDLYLAIIMNRYEGPHTNLTIALRENPLLSHYNGPLLRSPKCPYYSLA
jgi:hypothetical protein